MKDIILVIGASGQIGSELVMNLREIYGHDNVIASDIRKLSSIISSSGPFEIFDVLDEIRLREIVIKHNVTQVYLLAALLSASAEKDIEYGWKLNIRSHSNVLNLAKDQLIKKIFWPSSIAVFGPTTPKTNTPQYTIMEPNTVYGITKQASERWSEYYFNKFNIDIRSLRYPGLIGWRAKAGGGTTDYAVNIFHQAIQNKEYECFLKNDTALPMMYMPDAIRATIELMEAPLEKVKIRSSYNLGGISFTPDEIANEIKRFIPDFKMKYKVDFRQAIADSWPKSINDDYANRDWGWKAEFDLKKITSDMVENLRAEYKIIR